MRSIVLFSFVFFHVCLLKSQPGSFIIYGSITDQETGEPIENVNILVDNSETGSSTNDLGEFQIKINKLPFTLKISHINYENTWITYEFIPLRNLAIKLNPKAEQLPEITIQSEKIDIVYKDEDYSVLDYELTKDGVLLLIFKNRISRSELLYIDYNGKELSKLRVLPLKPLMLFADCLENINIISKNYVRQVHFDSVSIKLHKPVKLSHYKSIMGNCEFLLHDKLYFCESSYYNLLNTYYYVDTLDQTQHFLSTTGDESKVEFLRNYPENRSYINVIDASRDMNNLRGLPSDFEVLESVRNESVEMRFNKMAYYNAIYAPIFHLGDSVLIFNHPKNTIEIYNEKDSLIWSTPIDYHIKEKKTELGTFLHAFGKKKKWLEEVYVDPTTHRAFTMFQNLSGTRDFKEIDLKTGKLTYITTIPFPYVAKIKMKDNNLFFVYKGWGVKQQKKLFKQRIY